MLSSINKILILLNNNQKKNLLFFLILLIFSTIFEGLSIALIFPLIKIILDREYLYYLNEKISFIQITDFNEEKIIVITLFIIISMYLIKSFYLIFFSWWKSNFILKINNNISGRLFTKYVYSQYSFFFNKNSSEFIRNVYTEARHINTFIDAMLKTIVEIFTIIIILTILFLIQFKITLITLLFFGSFAVLFNFIFSNRIKKWGFEKQNFIAKVLQNMQQSFGSIKEILIRGNQNYFSKKFDHSLHNLNLRTQLLMFISEIPRNIIETISVFIICVVLFIGFEDINNFNELIPILGLFGAAALRIMPAFNRIIGNKQSIDSCFPSIELIFNELKNENKLINKKNILTEERLKTYEFKDEINFKDIGFSYPNSEKATLENINFKIKKNDCICLIGESGSGKTTLIDIISGLLSPDKGKVFLDGNEVSLTNDSWRQYIGYVSQSTYLIDDTIKNNILFGLGEEKKVDNGRLNLAIEYSQLNNLIKQNPEGLNYRIGENGIKLSGGQKQRIAIARTLYFNPKILILDEITSSLDDKTSEDLLTSLNKLSGKITMLYISHNNKVIKNANIVYKLMFDGKNQTIMEKKNY